MHSLRSDHPSSHEIVAERLNLVPIEIERLGDGVTRRSKGMSIEPLQDAHMVVRQVVVCVAVVRFHSDEESTGARSAATTRVHTQRFYRRAESARHPRADIGYTARYADVFRAAEVEDERPSALRIAIFPPMRAVETRKPPRS